MDDEREHLIRAVRQRLESLRRAGLDRIPAPRLPAPSTARRSGPAATPRADAATPSAAPASTPTPARTARPSVASVEPRPSGAVPIASSLFGESRFDSPPMPLPDRDDALRALAAEVASCARCPHLAGSRTQTVFGVGNPGARLMFIGEAPGAEEDRTGIPFVGRAGQLLTDMITKGMGLAREDVYIANILKCRPPNNRDPQPDEMANCLPYLDRQIEIVRPEFLCLLGRVSAQRLLDTAVPLARLRGRWHRYKGISTVVTYHPAYLLRNPADKIKAWDDLKMLMSAMGLKVPERRKS